jgi:type IV pilus assembly protein PilE
MIIIIKEKGFTLIELMIVITIIAIIAGIAIPSYNSSVIKARRSDAQQLLLDTANREAQYLLDARQYTNNFTNLGITKEGWSCSGTSCTGDFYTVAVSVDNTAAPPTFTITATATGDQLTDGNLTLNHLGAKTPSDKW